MLRIGGNVKKLLPKLVIEAFLIPQVAVFELQGKYISYVLDENNITKTRVLDVKGESGLNYIVTSGLEEGEIIVVEGVSKIKEGQEITPINSSNTSNSVALSDSLN